LQAQGYWIKDNWELFGLTQKNSYRDVALECSNNVARTQRADGSWEYPLKEWRKYVSTVEGTWASLGLLTSYKNTKNQTYLESAIKWYDFLVEKTGFQSYLDSLVINYFAFSSKRNKVPNNATLVLWFFAELYKVTGDPKFMLHTDGLIRFLELCQKPDGELIYEVGNDHYLCYHYNSFEFIDLLNFYNLTGNARIKAILIRLAKFIASGITEKGSVKYSCSQTFPELIWFSGPAGAALVSATNLQLGDYQNQVDRVYNYLMENQQPTGTFFYSTRDMVYLRNPVNWGFLKDRTSYPRQLTYILQHLLIGIQFLQEATVNNQQKE
jgi:rhamnogalacturonyl hydrolase YesR